LAAGPGVATLAEAIPIAGAPRTIKETQMNIPVPEIAMADLRTGDVATMSKLRGAILEEDGHLSALARRYRPA
jgi:uncharacterized membrane protein YcaP (DUF421 family)